MLRSFFGIPWKTLGFLERKLFFQNKTTRTTRISTSTGVGWKQNKTFRLIFLRWRCDRRGDSCGKLFFLYVPDNHKRSLMNSWNTSRLETVVSDFGAVLDSTCLAQTSRRRTITFIRESQRNNNILRYQIKFNKNRLIGLKENKN